MTELLAPNGKKSNLTLEQWNLVRTLAFKQWFGDWENLILSKLNDSGIDEVSLKRLEDGVSKVVDENGEPLVVYHGTDVSFNEYDLTKIGEGSDLLGKGIYLTKNKDVANFYANLVAKKRYIKSYEEGFLGSINPIYEENVNEKSEKHKIIYGFFVNAKNIKNINEIIINNDIKQILIKSIDFMFGNESENIINSRIDFANKNHNKILNYRGEIIYLIEQFPDAKKEILEYIKNKYDCIVFEPTTEFESNLKDYNNYVVFQPNQIKLADGSNTTFDGSNPDIRFEKGGRTIAQTPSLKKDQIYGSDKNKQGSSKSLKSAKQIKFDEQTLLSIANKVKQHNTKHPDKKITIDSAKAVVRRGMGAYSTSHRPTIKNGKPNNRIAWGLARLNAFTYKIINGKSKSGKYTQDDDLIKELNYMVKSYKDGGNVPKSNKMFHLPLELVVYVPSTKDVNKTISKQEMKERVDEVKNYLGVAFGGYSSIKIEGGYVANNGELVSESITKVVSFASKDDYEKNKDELVNQMTNWSQKWGQEAIGFEFEGDLYYVPEKLKKGGEITNTKNGETKIAKSGIHEGWGFKDTFKVLLKGAKSNIIKTFKELNLLFPDYDKEVIKGETIEIYIEENSFNKVKKIANYNDLTILYEDGGQIDYSTGWNQDYESDPLVIGKKKAKELATRGVLAYATRGQSELSRAANKGQDNENGQEQNEMFAQLAKSGALGKMEHGGEVHYSMGGQSMNNGIEKAFKEISEKNPPITNFLKRGGTTLKQENKISKVMREFKEGELHSGSKKGPVVKDREQAIAIALSEANVKRKRN